MAEFLMILSDGIDSVVKWYNTIGVNTVGINLISVFVTIATLALLLRFLILPSAFGGAGSDVTQKGRKRVK